MIKINRKRSLGEDDTNRISKMPRWDTGPQSRLYETSPRFSNPFKLQASDISADNTTYSCFNAAQCAASEAESTPKWRSLSDTSSNDVTRNSAIKSFTYQSLDDYRKAEALRILFQKNGLKYKQPQADVSVLSEDSLSEFIAQWEECFEHWHPILGSEEPSRAKSLTHCSSCRLSPSPLFGLSTKPAFKSTIAQWANSSSVQEQVRQIVQSEIRRQLDDLDNESPNTHQRHYADTQIPPQPSQNTSPKQPSASSTLHRMSKMNPLRLPPYMDNLTEMPEMIPVRQLPDGTLEYLKDENVAESPVM